MPWSFPTKYLVSMLTIIYIVICNYNFRQLIFKVSYWWKNITTNIIDIYYNTANIIDIIRQNVIILSLFSYLWKICTTVYSYYTKSKMRYQARNWIVPCTWIYCRHLVFGIWYLVFVIDYCHVLGFTAGIWYLVQLD